MAVNGSEGIFQPQPLRTFAQTSSTVTSSSTSTNTSSSPQFSVTPDKPSASEYDYSSDTDSIGGAPHKSQSIVSLTTSALVGIFGNSLNDANSRASTPDLLQTQPSSSTNLYGDGVARLRRNEGGSLGRQSGRPPFGKTLSASQLQQQQRRRYSNAAIASSANGSSTRLILFGKISLLFSFGVAYGHLITQLQDNHFVTNTTLNVDPIGSFTLTWGFMGIALGSILPFVDSISPALFGPTKNSLLNSSGSGVTMLMYPIIRAVGIFIGVSYGIRHLPWTSTLQGAVVLAVLNPLLWFAIDTSVNGFILSSLTAISGTILFAYFYPTHLPTSSGWSEDYIAVATWIASIFFCSSICFGMIGRKLLGPKNDSAASAISPR
ncbi:insulin-induced protein-domain-containing protein [Myxozyma melibiosi]|uniref:Insulin-induced protein-domain-containing protein n=1 Tax=Myxozyma melibiosi TaxID=54550 RepID=A0ABR1F4E0_9ASCO